LACSDSSDSADTITEVDSGTDMCDSDVTMLSSALLEFVAAPNLTVVLSEDVLLSPLSLLVNLIIHLPI
jgi:hypothetical protein